MANRDFKLLELRPLAHLALLATVAVGGYMYGPPMVRRQLDEWIVSPVSHTARILLNRPSEADVHPPTPGPADRP